MSFTVLRVEVQQWKDEGIYLPVGGQSEEGVEADDVVEEEGNGEGCGHFEMSLTEEFDSQVDIGDYVRGWEENVQYQYCQDRHHLHH